MTEDYPGLTPARAPAGEPPVNQLLNFLARKEALLLPLLLLQLSAPGADEEE